MYLNLGSVPAGALVTGIAFENLTVATVGSSYVNELCLVFFTDQTSFSSPVCLAPDYAAPAPEGLLLDGQGPRILEAIRAPAAGLRAEIGENPNANDNVGAPDAFLNGTLIVQYVEELASGFDYEDAASIFCNGIDCAVDDFHDIVLDAEEGKTYFIGILNARHITGSAHVDSVAMGGTQERYKETLSYALDITVGTDTVPCYQGCNGAGECTGALAPVCSCDEGFFGIACEIVPAALPVGTSPETAAAVSGEVPQGRFDYYAFELPEEATSLVLTMTSPRGVEDSVPAMFVKRGGLPRKCDSIQGVALPNCVDDYDFAAEALSRTLSDADTRVYQLVITPATNATLTGEPLLGAGGAGGKWYVSVHSDLVGFDDLTYTLGAFQTSDIQCQVLDCSGNGICDTSVGLCRCVERDGLEFGRDDCSAPIYVAAEGVPLTVSDPVPPGQAAFVSVEVNCAGQDLVMTATRPVSNAGAEFEIVMPGAPGLEPDFDLPMYVSWEAMAAPGDYRGYYAYFPSQSGGMRLGEATVNNLPPGVYTIGVFNYFDSTADLVDLEFTYSLRASLSPNAFNGCEEANERLTLDLVSTDGSLIETLLGPSAGTTRDYKGGQGCDLREANFIGTGEFCGTEERSCLFASNHTTYPSESVGLVSGVGSGSVAGRLVFGVSAATANNADYYYAGGSVNKQSGVAGPEVEGLLYQALAGGDSFDFEGCGPLMNPGEIEGNICVLVRGGCTFSQKVVNCQRAGATAAVIVNSRVNDCAITMAGAYVGEIFQIPAAMISNRAGVRILESALAESDPDAFGPPSEMELSAVNLSGVTGAYNVASCEPSEKCPECGEGRFDFAGADERTCADLACPGVSPSGSLFFGDVYNCTGNGVDDGSGGCSVSASGATCTCAPGFIGEDCSTPATVDCPVECTACQNCVRSFCFTISCPFCEDGLSSLGVGYEEGMLNGCDSDVCAACIE